MKPLDLVIIFISFALGTHTPALWVQIKNAKVDTEPDTPYSKMAAILVLFCLLANKPLLPRLRENILLYFEFKNEVASKQNNTKLAAVLNKVYYVMLAVTDYFVSFRCLHRVLRARAPMMRALAMCVR